MTACTVGEPAARRDWLRMGTVRASPTQQVRTISSPAPLTSSVNLNGTTVPGLTTRRANTEVEMAFGQTLVIAGLISNRVVSEERKTPFLGELPLIGALFRRIRHDESETELLVLVTPHPVSPLGSQIKCFMRSNRFSNFTFFRRTTHSCWQFHHARSPVYR